MTSVQTTDSASFPHHDQEPDEQTRLAGQKNSFSRVFAALRRLGVTVPQPALAAAHLPAQQGTPAFLTKGPLGAAPSSPAKSLWGQLPLFQQLGAISG